MKTTLLTAALALVLISISSISSFAKDDDEDAYRSSHRDGYRSHYREITTNDRRTGKKMKIWIADATDGAIRAQWRE
jgi:hypothetical protein